MEQITSVQKALDYIESHLIKIEDPSDIAKKLHVPWTDLQTGFTVIVGYSIPEYIRNRRLYEAAKEIMTSDVKIIDISYKYGYESPDSFSKAFYKFHGVLPSKISQAGNTGRVFRPITVDLSVNGGFETNYRIDRRYGFKLIGLPASVKEKNIDRVWEEFFWKYRNVISHEKPPQNDIENAIAENSIGEYGIYDTDNGIYVIAGRYAGGTIPDQFILQEFDPASWAVCEQRGAITRESIERLAKLMAEDIFDNADYRIKQAIRLESFGTMIRTSQADGNYCMIQIPVENTAKSSITPLVRIVNAVSVVLLLFALAVGAHEYRVKSEKAMDANVLYNMAQYSINNERTEGKTEYGYPIQDIVIDTDIAIWYHCRNDRRSDFMYLFDKKRRKT